jgi:hypothetical protein
MIVALNSNWKKILNETVLTSFGVLSQHFSGETEESHEHLKIDD